MSALSLRLPPALSRALDSLASETDRPKSYLVRKAIEAYLLEYSDCQTALDRLRDTGDPVISGPELRKRLGL